MQKDAADRLTKHRASLDSLRKSLDGKRSKQADKEAEQNALMARLSEEISQAAMQTKEKRTRLESARRARQETAAAIQANVEACANSVAVAAAVHRGAVEHFAAAKAAVEQLGECVGARSSAAALSEVERDARAAAVAQLEADQAQAINMRKQAEASKRVATAALDSHTQDAARRARAHEVEVRRAEERVSTATALRDLASRRWLQDEDSAALAEAEKKAQSAVESAVEALSAAKERRNAARTTDAEASAKFYSALEKSTSDFNSRQHVAATMIARVDASKKIHRDSVKAHNCAVAALKVVQTEHASQRVRLEEALKAEVDKTAEALNLAEEALEAAQKEQSETPQRHAEDAEALVLQRQEESEATLIAAVGEARISAAEAHDDAQEIEESSNGPQELDLLLTSAIGHFDDRQRLAQEMAQAHQDARDAVDEAQKELEGSKQKLAEAESSIPGEAHRELRQRVASVEAKVEYLLQVADEREAALSGAQDAVQTAAEELKDLEEQQKLTPKGVVPLDMLVRGELATVSELIDDRRKARTKVLEEAKGASTEWAAKRQELSVSLHTASLQVAAAEDAVEATKQLRKTVAGAL